MKKIMVIFLAICMALMAAPAMAVDTEFSGYYRAQGFHNTHTDLQWAGSDSIMTMRFRLNTVFKASDALSVTTRFDALDKTWGVTDLPGAPSDDNIDFDRGFMTIMTDYGKFDIGRMAGSVWGTSFLDSEGDFDRLKYTAKFGDIILVGIYEKITEQDANTITTDMGTAGSGADAGDTGSDSDNDTYAAAALYLTESIKTGMLIKYYDYQSASDEEAAGSDHRQTMQWLFSPYVEAKLGPLGVNAEIGYVYGEHDYDQLHEPNHLDADIEAFAIMLEGTFDFGMGNVFAGYAMWTGDDLNNRVVTTQLWGEDNEDSDWTNGPGADWEKLWILTGTTDPASAILGPGLNNLTAGNLATAGSSACLAGAHVFYLGGEFKASEQMTVGLIVGHAEAEDEMTDYDEDYGMEYDFTISYQIMDNLSYKAIMAYLDAGDFWKGQGNGGANATVTGFDDTMSMFHELKLSF